MNPEFERIDVNKSFGEFEECVREGDIVYLQKLKDRTFNKVFIGECDTGGYDGGCGCCSECIIEDGDIILAVFRPTNLPPLPKWEK